ncbi:unnamed protein product, partial [Discosporangium mesarthrocarpum]
VEIELAHAVVPPMGTGGSPSGHMADGSPSREYSGGMVTLKRKDTDLNSSSHVRTVSSGSNTTRHSFSNVGMVSQGDECDEGGNGGEALPHQDLALRIAVDRETAQSYFVDWPTVCDECPFCDDLCEVWSCKRCNDKRKQLEHEYGPLMPPSLLRSSSTEAEDHPCMEREAPATLRWRFANKRVYTLCEVRRRNLSGSCWVVCKNSVYDVTDLLHRHPGGKRSVLRNAGGRNCEEDFHFHSKTAQKRWKKSLIGSLVKCHRGRGEGE